MSVFRGDQSKLREAQARQMERFAAGSEDDRVTDVTRHYRRGYQDGWRAACRKFSWLCRTCNGIGSVPGFWLGTIKECPACKGKGRHGD